LSDGSDSQHASTLTKESESSRETVKFLHATRRSLRLQILQQFQTSNVNHAGKSMRIDTIRTTNSAARSAELTQLMMSMALTT